MGSIASIKNWIRYGSRACALFALSFVLAACGDALGGRSRTSGTGGFGGNSRVNQGSGGSMNAPNVKNGTGPNTGYSAELQQCDQYRMAAQSVINACNATFQQAIADEDVSRACAQSYNKIFDTNCSTIQSSLQSAFSGCNTEISQYLSYFPPACQQALRQFIR